MGDRDMRHAGGASGGGGGGGECSAVEKGHRQWGEGERHASAFQATAAAPLSLTFVDLTYTVTLRDGSEKTVLDHLSGHVSAGSFVAIMGPSGSGKTSLINALAGRVARSRRTTLSGEVLVNGRPPGADFQRLSAYVLQGDTMLSCLTVGETLWVAARLRLPRAFGARQRRELVESVIAELGLEKARNTYIGDDLVRGVSGGERKRTSIAVEMLSNPSLVFLDEPTSGLDSFQAMNIISCVADLASGGRTVIATIHQPRSAIFSLFQDLILLTEGQMAYYGRASDSVSYFADRGFRCPPHYNPADFFMDLISEDTRDPQSETASKERVRAIAGSFQAAAHTQVGMHVAVPGHPMGSAQPGDGAGPALQPAVCPGHAAEHDFSKGRKETNRKYGKYASGYWTQLSTLGRRALWQVSRDWVHLAVLFFQALFMSLLISLLYYGEAEGPQQIQNFEGVVFFICIFLAMTGAMQMVITFPQERRSVNQERASRAYSVAAYYPAKVLPEWPFRVSPVVLFISIVYWPVQFQRTPAKFFLFLAVAVLEFTAMTAVGLAVGACAPSPETALAFGPVITILFALFGGFMVNLESIPVWIRWFRYLSPVQWAFIGFTNTQFSGLTFSCPPDSFGCVSTGEAVLDNLNVNGFSVGESLACQAALIAGLNLIAFLALLFNGPKFHSMTREKVSKSQHVDNAPAAPAGIQSGRLEE